MTITGNVTIEDPIDVHVENHGSIVLFNLRTSEARAWWAEHAQDGMRFNGKPVVEPRYVQDLIDGLEGDGLVVAV